MRLDLNSMFKEGSQIWHHSMMAEPVKRDIVRLGSDSYKIISRGRSYTEVVYRIDENGIYCIKTLNMFNGERNFNHPGVLELPKHVESGAVFKLNDGILEVVSLEKQGQRLVCVMRHSNDTAYGLSWWQEGLGLVKRMAHAPRVDFSLELERTL